MPQEPDVPQKLPYVMEMEPGVYMWCACGKSDNQPFCDGSHDGTAFSPIREKVEEKKKVAWCGCKHTGNAPMCDGSHQNV